MRFKSSVSFFVFLFSAYSITLWAQEKIPVEQVIAIALEKNYDVQFARNISEAATTDDNYAWAAYLPRLNATGSTVWNNNDQQLEFQDASRNASGNAQSHNVNGSVQLTWTLFDGTRMFATRQRISEIAEQGELFVKNQMVNTIAEITINYYNIVSQKQQLKAIQEQIAVNEERVKLAQRKLDVGTGGKPELLQAKVDLNEQRTLMIEQEIVISQLKEQLNSLLGLQLPSGYDVADTIVIDLNLKREEIESNIENSNYGLLTSRYNLNIAELSLRESRADLFPILDFNASYNYSNTNNQRLINPFAALKSQTNGYNYGFYLTVPIFNGFNSRRLIQQAQINTHRQQLLYDQQKTEVSLGLKNAFVAYDNAKKILLIEEENILLAKENVFIALEGFKRGIITSIELRTAQQSLESAYTRLITARYNSKLAETELRRLNGSLLQ